jgi:hypothetical protein
VEVEISGLKITQGDLYQGSGIFNRGDLILRNCEISGCGSSYGGDAAGIYNDGDGKLYIDGCVIKNNLAYSGYGVGIYNAGDLIITASQISDNYVEDHSHGVPCRFFHTQQSGFNCFRHFKSLFE